MTFGYGGSAGGDTLWYIRPRPGGERKSGECVRFDDQIVVAYSKESSQDQCGWYGCRVLARQDREAQLTHGGDSPQSFYLRTRSKALAGQCIKFGDAFVLSADSNTCRGATCGNCGEFGCRKLTIAEVEGNQVAIFNHGGKNSAARELYMVWRGN